MQFYLNGYIKKSAKEQWCGGKMKRPNSRKEWRVDAGVSAESNLDWPSFMLIKRILCSSITRAFMALLL